MWCHIAVFLLLLQASSPRSAAVSTNERPKPPQVRRFFASRSFWNTPVPSNPLIAPNSAKIVTKSILPFAGNATFANSDEWGIAIAHVNGASRRYKVSCTIYCTGDNVEFPIPAGARPSSGSDHHLAVVSGRTVLDMWEASYDAATDRWSAGVRVLNDLYGWGAFCAEGRHCNGANAAGFSLLGGLVRPEEIAQGRIDHALALITPYTRANFIACPATHTDGKNDDPDAIPEGARVQLDPAFDVDSQPWPTWEKAIAKALQTYGAYVVDTGGALALRGVNDVNPGRITWDTLSTPKGAHITDIPWSRLRVLRIRPC